MTTLNAAMRAAAAARPLVTGLLGLLTLLLGACGEEPPVFRVGTLGFSAEEMRSIPTSSQPELADVAAWGLAVREEATDSLLAPLIRRAGEQARLGVLPFLLGARRAGLTDADLRSAYAASPEWELEVRHVVRLADQGAPAQVRQRARAEAEGVLERARAGEDFATLAGEVSEEPGAAERGGLLQPGRQGTWVDAFWQAALLLEPGEISDVVQSEYGFHVLKLENRRPVPFEEADLAALLQRVVPPGTASAAMEEWVARAPDAVLDDTPLESVRAKLIAGELRLDSVFFSASDRRITGEDLAAAWASSSAEERGTMMRDAAAFERWLEQQVREAVWAAEALRLGAPIPRDREREARMELRGIAGRWAYTFGFEPGMALEPMRAAVLRGAASTGQEYRIARQEIAGLRPILRALYPASFSGEPEPS